MIQSMSLHGNKINAFQTVSCGLGFTVYGYRYRDVALSIQSSPDVLGTIGVTSANI